MEESFLLQQSDEVVGRSGNDSLLALAGFHKFVEGVGVVQKIREAEQGCGAGKAVLGEVVVDSCFGRSEIGDACRDTDSSTGDNCYFPILSLRKSSY
jgi:hypothetical protein